ncbi:MULTISPECIES: GNAT family N-acetyltransferase [unclassified Streptomyces]|uniref:GNAT family N-acetyltransferase n=1 Tax=unclassified Streptomyces TaxID=2593676 RepID=UPI0022B696F9|nr:MULTISPECIES: GNAT family protein [unclassified Streptomyces]MCZ7416995.1 GNAT family protein [Streptomyces sp. WMMC897]MCZ7433177.1 GNAT family protein [Streptomyces sp. WMMC1477]
MTLLHGSVVTLRTATAEDVPALAAIRATPEVLVHWRGSADLESEVREELEDDEITALAVEYEERVVGLVQWYAETEPDYRHAGIDIFLEPGVHGRGLGTDAVRTVAAHLIDDHGFHRIVIDPAAHNAVAIRCYQKVGFRPVGIMRQYERGLDGTWHDGLLMDLLADELVRPT